MLADTMEYVPPAIAHLLLEGEAPSEPKEHDQENDRFEARVVNLFCALNALC
jgi:hypothetical protein